MAKQKILVIGACGQLGSELTEKLVDAYGCDDIVAADVRQPNGIVAQSNFEILDVLNRDRLFALVSKYRFTQIYHLAAILSAAGEKDPTSAWKLNMDGLINVLDAAVLFSVEKIYWPSSIAVFGPSTPKIDTPQSTIMDPSTIYGVSKQAGERWCEWYHHKHGVDIRSLRYPGLISYKTKPGGGTTDYAVEIFFKALSEKKYECFLKPDTYLPMMYMEDALRATFDLMDAPSGKIKVRSSYNIAAMSFSPAEIAAEIQKHVPDFEITYHADFRQKIADSWPCSIDDSDARKDWGWQPGYDLARMSEEIMERLASLVQ